MASQRYHLVMRSMIQAQAIANTFNDKDDVTKFGKALAELCTHFDPTDNDIADVLSKHNINLEEHGFDIA